MVTVRQDEMLPLLLLVTQSSPPPTLPPPSITCKARPEKDEIGIKEEEEEGEGELEALEIIKHYCQ